jgi:hypothetical protein
MASKSKKTEMRRLKKNKRQGHDRKASLENKGTTPSQKALFKD